jgi:hypothetical protein
MQRRGSGGLAQKMGTGKVGELAGARGWKAY